LEEVSQDEEQAQVERVEAVRAGRDDTEVETALAAIQTAASGDENLMPRLVRAAKARATVGEICDALRDEFGEHRPGT